MLRLLSILRGSAGLRASAVAILLFGFAGAATGPYLSVVAIRELGLSDVAFSALTLAGAALNVLGSIAIGIAADRTRRYRATMLVLAGCGVIGFGAVWAIGTPLAFAFAKLVPLSAYGGLYSLLFAAARVYSGDLTRAEAATVSSFMRGLISVAWIVFPGLVGLALYRSSTLLPVFLIAAAVTALMLVCLALMMPADTAPAPAAGPKEGLGAALRLLASLPLALRVLGVALITSVLHVSDAVMPLIATGRAGGTAADVGLIFGLVAALEVVFILIWARIARDIAPIAALAVGIAIYAVYLVLLAQASQPWHVYAATILGGVGAAAIISLPLGYLLALIAARPGLSASLLSVNVFLGGAIGAGLFALGTAIGDYGTVAWLGAIAGGIGAVLLLALEGWRVRVAA